MEILKIYTGKELKGKIQEIRSKVKQLREEDVVTVKCESSAEVTADNKKRLDELICDDEKYVYRYDDFTVIVEPSVISRGKKAKPNRNFNYRKNYNFWQLNDDLN